MRDPALLASFLALAVLFDFLNGFHDAANVVATMIASRAMSPRSALVMVAVAHFVGPLLFGVAVATTVGKEVVRPGAVTITVVMAALVAASVWNIVTWWFGIPASSSHALAGGLIGGALVFGGWTQLKAAGLIKIGAALFLSPVVGFLLAWILLRATMRATLRSTPRVNRTFRRLQVVSSIALSLSHGSNDAQKTMGIITLALVTLDYQSDFAVPMWVVLISAAAISAGTASGGWRIIRTLGGKFYRIRPVHALTSQVASASVIIGASLMGGPVSTTHVVSSSIVGAGASHRKSMVRWSNLTEIGVAWLVTVPAAALVAAGCYLVLRPLIGA